MHVYYYESLNNLQLQSIYCRPKRSQKEKKVFKQNKYYSRAYLHKTQLKMIYNHQIERKKEERKSEGEEERGYKDKKNPSLSTLSSSSSHHDEPPKQCVGILKSTWEGLSHKEEIIKYGTGTLISPNLVLTCAHNIFFQEKKKVCTKVEFFPNVDQGRLTHDRGYMSAKGKFYQCLAPVESFKIKPTKQEFCLIFLQEKAPFKDFLPLSTLENPWKFTRNQIALYGYPSQQYYFQENIQKIQPERVYSSGKILSFEDCSIRYDMKTKVGMSGGALLTRDDSQRVSIIGIHTHSGIDGSYTCGVYFSVESIQLIKTFEKNLRTRYGNVKRILYLSKDSEQMYNDLDSSFYSDESSDDLQQFDFPSLQSSKEYYEDFQTSWDLFECSRISTNCEDYQSSKQNSLDTKMIRDEKELALEHEKEINQRNITEISMLSINEVWPDFDSEEDFDYQFIKFQEQYQQIFYQILGEDRKLSEEINGHRQLSLENESDCKKIGKKCENENTIFQEGKQITTNIEQHRDLLNQFEIYKFIAILSFTILQLKIPIISRYLLLGPQLVFDELERGKIP